MYSSKKFQSLNFDESDHQDVLIAGLGGGVMSNFFSQISYLNVGRFSVLHITFYYILQIDTTVVEKEEFIINIAENYFDHFETDEMRIINTDFVDYLRKCNRKT